MKKYLIPLAILIIIAASIGLYMYNKPHRDASAASSDFVITSDSLFAQFQKDETAANEKYLDKMVEVKGTVMDLVDNEDGSTGLMLQTGDPMFGISCRFDQDRKETLSKIKAGDEVAVRGVCTGMLMDVVMIRCALTDNK